MRRLLACALLCASTVRAEAPRDVVTAIALARIAEERGPSTLRAQVEAGAHSPDMLASVRASAYSQAAATLIAPLAALACGRHPVLAPEAAFALFRAAERLQPSDLEASETLLADLRDARAALACANLPRPRADIASLLELAAAAIDALLRFG